jgi:hypothetical protein
MSSFDHKHPATFSQLHPSETSISSSVDDQIHGLECLPLPEKPPSFDDFTAASEAFQRGIFNKLEREVWDRINRDTKIRIERWLGKGFEEGDETYKDFISTLLETYTVWRRSLPVRRYVLILSSLSWRISIKQGQTV